VEDAGVLFIGVALLLLPPSLLGYIGALRLNSVLLLLVSVNFHLKGQSHSCGACWGYIYRCVPPPFLPPSLLGYIGALRLNSVLLLLVSVNLHLKRQSHSCGACWGSLYRCCPPPPPSLPPRIYRGTQAQLCTSTTGKFKLT
jgi:hypothetical protein